MKKTYIIPTTNVLDVQTVNIIALSAKGSAAIDTDDYGVSMNAKEENWNIWSEE